MGHQHRYLLNGVTLCGETPSWTETVLMLHLWTVNKQAIGISYHSICVATDQLGAAAFSVDVVSRSAQPSWLETVAWFHISVSAVIFRLWSAWPHT